MNTNSQNQEQSAFNLKDLLNDENIQKYKNIDPNFMLNLDKKPDKEELRRRLRAKTNSLRNNRMNKSIREQNQVNAMKENPLFKNIDTSSKEDIKTAIETMASNMTKDSKQKKNIKKQMEKMVEKIKEPTIEII